MNSSKLKHKVAFGVTGTVWKTFARLPEKAALTLGETIGRSLAPFLKRERRMASAQIQLALRSSSAAGTALALHGASEAGRKRIFNDVLAHVGASVAELSHFEKLLEQSGTDHSGSPTFTHFKVRHTTLAREYKAEPRGTVALSGHIGNFELLAAYTVRSGVPLTVIGRAPNYPALATFVDNLRQAYGVDVLWREGRATAVGLRRALLNDRVLAVLIDQDTALDNAFSEFFNVKAAHPVAPIQLAVKHKLRIITTFLVRTAPFEHEDVTQVVDYDPNDPDAVTSILRTYSARLEALVAEHPDQWLWWHRRWRRRPGVAYGKTGIEPRGSKDYEQWLLDGAADEQS